MWFCRKQIKKPIIEVVKRTASTGFVDWVIRKDEDGFHFLGVDRDRIYWWRNLEHVRNYASFPNENAAVTRFEQYVAEQGPFMEEIVIST